MFAIKICTIFSCVENFLKEKNGSRAKCNYKTYLKSKIIMKSLFADEFDFLKCKLKNIFI